METFRTVVVLIGSGASGKTTRCRRHAPADMIPEYTPGGAAAAGKGSAAGSALGERLSVTLTRVAVTSTTTVPGGAGIPARAGVWTAVSCRGWQAALDREPASGLAVCDDPLKPHYSWSLARIGAAAQVGVPSPPPASRPDRGDPAVLDGWIEALPRLD